MKPVQVAIFAPVWGVFDYLAPENSQRGARVIADFGQREVLGMIWNTEISEPHPQIKPITQLLEEEPLFDTHWLDFLQFTAHYYQYPLGATLETALPQWLRQDKKLPPPKNIKTLPQTTIELTSAQQRALAEISLERKFAVHLLEGVTGSGKSEIYAQWIAQFLALHSSGQFLILVPEIGLIPQLLQLLQKRLDLRGTLYHSEMTPKQRAEAWQAARLGSVDFIVGTRSAVFLPFADLAGVIVDEEHDLSYKQQEKLRYHARDLAIWRAKKLQIPVILGSATPSLEALHQVKLQRWKSIQLQERALTHIPPRVVINDDFEGRLGHLHLGLIREMRQTLQNGEQVLLFLNRRGFAPVLCCKYCHYRCECVNCSRVLTAHLNVQQLICHHCGHREALPFLCPKCSQTMHLVGLGTERLEQELHRQFPDARILRIDTDAFTTAKRFAEAVERVKNGEIDIILGTQWLTKGHHFPRLKLVAVVDADAAFWGADFRNEERLAQLLMQVGGRAGRENQGTIWIQTNFTNHFIYQVFRENYRSVAKRLYGNRQAASLPPFSAQALFIAQHKNEEKAFEVLENFRARFADLNWFGPAPAILAKRAGVHRVQLLLQTPTKAELQKLLPDVYSDLRAHAGTVKITLDVEPLILD